MYAAAMMAALGAAISMSGVKPRYRPRPREAFSWKTVLAGMHYIWREKLVLGSISLDLFAVLLGGAVALLPVYATRNSAKQARGDWACCVARRQSARRPWRSCSPSNRCGDARGPKCCGAWRASVCSRFCLDISHSLALSMIALILVGATDMVSVVVRGILIQLATPDRNARARECGGHDFHRGVERIRTIRIRRNGGMVRDGSRSRPGRRGSDCGYCVVGLDVPGVAKCRPAHICGRSSIGSRSAEIGTRSENLGMLWCCLARLSAKS